MLVRRTLQFALLALVVAVVLTIVWNIGLVVGEPTFGGILASYLNWGRWADFAMFVLFAALLIVAPHLPGTERAGHVVVAGAAIALVGDLMDPSIPNIDAGPSIIDNQLSTDFAVRHVFGFSIETAATYTWAAGIVLVGLGLLILSVDAEDRTWGRASAMLGIAFGVMALTDINVFGTQGVFWIVSWITMAILFYWLQLALGVTERTGGPATTPTQHAPVSLE